MASAGLRAVGTALIVAGLIFGLSACGGGGGGGGSDSPAVGSPPPPPSTTTPPPSQGGSDEYLVTELTGSVGDGPIVFATLSVFNRNGALVGTFESDATASFRVTVREKGKNYPLFLRAEKGTDLVTGGLPDFKLHSAVIGPGKNSRTNLNPHSTLMVDIASRSALGLSDNGLASARTTVLTELNFGFDQSLLFDPISSEITPENVAMVVKSSEALGEMIRRTRDALMGAGVRNADLVVVALGSDLVDGSLDGVGAEGTDPRISAVASMASAAVLVEVMQNHLRVGGADATAQMDSAIHTIQPDVAASTGVESVTLTGAMIEQTRIAVDAAWALTGDPLLETLRARVRELSAGMTTTEARDYVPAGAEQSLADAVMAAAYGSDAELEIVNSTVRRDGAADPEPPLEQTSPPTGGTGYATLSWVAPTQREDGTALTDLAAYRIHYGQSSGDLGQVVELRDPTVTGYTLQGLGTGTWYFTVSAVDSAGRESSPSNLASKTIS